MTAQALHPARADRRDESSRLRLDCSETGGWTLSGSRGATRQFADFEAALASARREPHSAAATIEVWEGGDYICCLPADEWPADGTLPSSGAAGQNALFPAIERAANRAAQVLLPAASFFFWVALMVAALAASLGWRFLMF